MPAPESARSARRSKANSHITVRTMFKRKPSKLPSIDTLIGARTRIHGDVEFSGGLHLDGHILGNVSSEREADASLSVGESGEIEGSVAVRDIVLNGIVTGDIDATNRVELGSKARVLGNVRYSVIESAVGAQISGNLIHRTSDGSGTSDGSAAVSEATDEAPL
jgi:cytoskeletal protein CcmA (bactofilin family)